MGPISDHPVQIDQPKKAKGDRPQLGSLDLSSVPSFGSAASESSRSVSHVTNTLLLTNLVSDFFESANLDALQHAIRRFGGIIAWAPIRGLGRVIVSLETSDQAVAVKQAVDGEDVLGRRIKAYFGEEVTLGPQDPHLNLPQAGKNWLISPPGSPPVGWEPIKEDPPNSQALPSDFLYSALQTLQNGDPTSERDPTPEEERLPSPSSTITTILAPEEGSELPGIVLEQWDESSASPTTDDSAGRAIRGTARPPIEQQ